MPWIRKGDHWEAHDLNESPQVIRCPKCKKIPSWDSHRTMQCECGALLMANPKLFNREVSVKGSTGNDYTVKVFDGKWTCTCIGYKTHKKDCKHIRSQK